MRTVSIASVLSEYWTDLMDICSVILVGFERIFTPVREDSGINELCVSIFTEAASLPTYTQLNFSLNLISISGTAGGLTTCTLFSCMS